MTRRSVHSPPSHHCLAGMIGLTFLMKRVRNEMSRHAKEQFNENACLAKVKNYFFNSTVPCKLTEEQGYVIFSASMSFYIPLVIMTTVYIKIFLATKERYEGMRIPKITINSIKSAHFLLNFWQTDYANEPKAALAFRFEKCPNEPFRLKSKPLMQCLARQDGLIQLARQDQAVAKAVSLFRCPFLATNAVLWNSIHWPVNVNWLNSKCWC